MDWKQLGSGALFAIGMLLLGFTSGGVIGGTVFSRSDMGWDRIADTLGGVMVGMAAAIVLTGAFVTRLTNRQRMLSAAACVVASILLVLVMQQTRGPSP